MACLISFLQQAQKARGIHPELRKYFYKEYSNLTWEEFLTTKFGLWVDTCSSTDITLHGRGRAMKKVALYFNLKKELKAVMLTLHAMCSVLKMQ